MSDLKKLNRFALAGIINAFWGLANYIIVSQFLSLDEFYHVFRADMIFSILQPLALCAVTGLMFYSEELEIKGNITISLITILVMIFGIVQGNIAYIPYCLWMLTMPYSAYIDEMSVKKDVNFLVLTVITRIAFGVTGLYVGLSNIGIMYDNVVFTVALYSLIGNLIGNILIKRIHTKYSFSKFYGFKDFKLSVDIASCAKGFAKNSYWIISNMIGPAVVLYLLLNSDPETGFAIAILEAMRIGFDEAFNFLFNDDINSYAKNPDARRVATKFYYSIIIVLGSIGIITYADLGLHASDYGVLLAMACVTKYVLYIYSTRYTVILSNSRFNNIVPIASIISSLVTLCAVTMYGTVTSYFIGFQIGALVHTVIIVTYYKFKASKLIKQDLLLNL